MYFDNILLYCIRFTHACAFLLSLLVLLYIVRNNENKDDQSHIARASTKSWFPGVVQR